MTQIIAAAAEEMASETSVTPYQELPPVPGAVYGLFFVIFLLILIILTVVIGAALRKKKAKNARK